MKTDRSPLTDCSADKKITIAIENGKQFIALGTNESNKFLKQLSTLFSNFKMYVVPHIINNYS